ncbi:hypothetical protein EDB89DRAFT_1963939 [Lactarius sanguifluus]|nr:hypothetical protein EDB89DRAFT_1963939 [Lactarius sanguifluus]
MSKWQNGVQHTISGQPTRQRKQCRHQTIITPLSLFNLASENVGHFQRDDDLELTRCAWLQADYAYIRIWVVEVLTRKSPATLSDRRVQCRSPEQQHVRRACSLVDRCIAEVILGPRSLRRDKLCPCTVRCNQSSFDTIVATPILIHMWGVEVPWVLGSNGVPGWWCSLSALHPRTPRTGTILDVLKWVGSEPCSSLRLQPAAAYKPLPALTEAHG